MFKQDLKTKRLFNLFMTFALALAIGFVPGCKGDDSKVVPGASDSSDFSENSLCIKTRNNGHGNVWYLQLRGVPRVLEENTVYMPEVYFMPKDNGEPDVANDGGNNPRFFALDISFRTDLFECLGITYVNHYDPDNPFQRIWMGGLAPSVIDNENGYFDNVMGVQEPGMTYVYYPDESIDPAVNEPYNYWAKLGFRAKMDYEFTNGEYEATNPPMTWTLGDDTIATVDDIEYWMDDPIQVQLSYDNESVNAYWIGAEYILHLGVDGLGVDSFPQETAGEPFYTGPAAARQTLSWIYGDPYNLYTVDQAALYSAYHGGTSGQDMSAADMRTLLQGEKPATNPGYAYNFSAHADDDEDMAVKRIVHWTDFNVQTYYPSGTGINEPQVPAMVATFDATYGSKWKTIRGLATDMDPCDESSVFTIPDMTVYGLWINDPAQGGLGYNVYLTGDEFRGMYEQVDGKYRSVCEPPELSSDEMEQLEASLVDADICYERGSSSKKLAGILKGGTSKVSLDARSKSSDELTLQLADVSWKEVIPDQLLNSPDFKNIYTKCKLAKVIQVAGLDDEEDFTLVTFSQSKNNSASIVILVDKESGKFRKATWTSEDREYLPISAYEAMKIAMNALYNEKKISKEQTSKNIYSIRSLIRLAYSKGYAGSHFMPMYEVNIFGAVVYVMQDGTYSVK